MKWKTQQAIQISRWSFCGEFFQMSIWQKCFGDLFSFYLAPMKEQNIILLPVVIRCHINYYCSLSLLAPSPLL